MTLFYHKNCADGFCAAYLFGKVIHNHELIPINYGDPIPDVKENDAIIFADFCPLPEEIERLAKKAEYVMIQDHHESRIKPYLTGEMKLPPKVVPMLDLQRSGAKIMYDWLWNNGHEVEQYKWLVDYVEDRDLWRWNLPQSREVNAYIRSFSMTELSWNQLMRDGLNLAAQVGERILDGELKMVDLITRGAQPWTNTAGEQLVLVNSPILQSEIGDILSQKFPNAIVLVWSLKYGSTIVSVRSKNGKAMEFAMRYPGGGGHLNAAGFRIKFDDFVKAFPL